MDPTPTATATPLLPPSPSATPTRPAGYTLPGFDPKAAFVIRIALPLFLGLLFICLIAWTRCKGRAKIVDESSDRRQEAVQEPRRRVVEAVRGVPYNGNPVDWIKDVGRVWRGDAKWGSGHGIVTLRRDDLEGGSRPG